MDGFSSLVGDAIKSRQDDEKKAAEQKGDFDFGEPKIFVVGCGGAGNNTINRLSKLGVEGAETIALNTDKIHLDYIAASKKLLIGKTLTRGLGAGGYPDVGQRAAELSRSDIEDTLKNADLVFVTAGLGGGTGTGSAPVVAEIAKKMGAIVIGMVSSPFKVERSRVNKAKDGLEKLRKNSDTVIVLDNNRLLEYVPNLPIDQAFSVMDQIISETVKGISEAITQPSLINLDYADVKSIMEYGGIGVMLYGETSGQDRDKNVVHEVLSHPLLDLDYTGATGALIHITGGPDMTLREAEYIAQNLTRQIDPEANVIWGARVVPEFSNMIKVMAIMTGAGNVDGCPPKNESGTATPIAPAAKKTPVPAKAEESGVVAETVEPDLDEALKETQTETPEAVQFNAKKSWWR